MSDQNDGISPQDQVKAKLDRTLESLRGTTTFAELGVKTAILINGGATIAVLAFIGHLWTAEQPDTGRIAALLPAMRQFVSAVLAGGSATVVAYLTQFIYTHAEAVESPRAELILEIIGIFLNLTGLGLIIWTYWLFANGVWIAEDALTP